MGKRTISIFGLIAILALVMALALAGCNEPDPAAELLKAQGVATTPPPAAPADASKDASAGTAADTKDAGAAAEKKDSVPTAGGDKPAAEAGTDAAKTPEAGKDAATKPDAGKTAPDAKAGGAAADGKDAENAEDKPEAKDAAADKAADKKDAKEGKEGEETAEPPAATTDQDKIENFKNLDPRLVVIRKYEKVAEKHTEPWNEEKEDEYIPQTGRVDPLQPVSSAIPEELMPPRSGETDENQIQTYLLTQACTQVVDTLRQMIYVHNVIQIGATKYVSISTTGDARSAATIPVGQPIRFAFGVVNGQMITAQVSVVSASDSEVVIAIGASASGTVVSKTQTYIPREIYR